MTLNLRCSGRRGPSNVNRDKRLGKGIKWRPAYVYEYLIQLGVHGSCSICRQSVVIIYKLVLEVLMKNSTFAQTAKFLLPGYLIFLSLGVIDYTPDTLSRAHSHTDSHTHLIPLPSRSERT